jgi:hypothetical protein
VADREYGEMERLAAVGVEMNFPVLFTGAVASIAELGLIAHLRGDDATADEHHGTCESPRTAS